MEEYHKIQTVFKRDPETKFKTLLEGEFSLPEFEYLKDNRWIFTEKVDGTNIRVIYKANTVYFKGKTDKADIPSFLLENLVKMFTVDKMKSVFNETEVCLYGEGYGAKIQKGGGNYSETQKFVLFDIKIDKWWLLRADIEEIAKSLNIEIAPVVGRGTLKDMVWFVKNGFTSKWGNFMAEGIVARPQIELKTRNGSRIITKIKHKDFH